VSADIDLNPRIPLGDAATDDTEPRWTYDELHRRWIFRGECITRPTGATPLIRRDQVRAMFEALQITRRGGSGVNSQAPTPTIDERVDELEAEIMQPRVPGDEFDEGDLSDSDRDLLAEIRRRRAFGGAR